jgi:hypothetical protein
MAQLPVDVSRLNQPEAWPDCCVKCGATGTRLIPVAPKYMKKIEGCALPCCPKHENVWEVAAKRNAFGIFLVLCVMAITGAAVWFLHPIVAPGAQPDSRFVATFGLTLLSAIVSGLLLAIWVGSMVRVDRIEGRYAYLAGVCKKFVEAATITTAPAPLHEVREEFAFRVGVYKPRWLCPPNSAGLLFGSSLIFGLLFGVLIGYCSGFILEATEAWERNSWKFVGLAFALSLFMYVGILGGSLLNAAGKALLVVGGIAIAVLIAAAKLVGPSAYSIFAICYALAPLPFFLLRLVLSIVKDGRIRHPGIAGLCALLGPLLYAGAAYAASGFSLTGPHTYAFVIGPIAAFVFTWAAIEQAAMPYCDVCEAWLESRRLGSLPRPVTAVRPILEDGKILSLVGETTYPEKASMGDVELRMYHCAACLNKGTLVLELQECKPAGKNKSPTLFKVGAWQYPGVALDVVNKIFPPAADEPAPNPPREET